ncbi:HNH endonuclease [Streptomyces sp. DSM 110735]|uniref:HNH endonuclease signature motif containing protein n=1 Tax=Streptomyces sp. DSM 110735 TaxID=2775031 RepID=UPI0018F4D679|nr:HNH endonuclease signature motif containing protein [Streptomyces sp. DSM 110735]MBJ7903813.1 HNH endonuclease [Streptomyces sp. DSM 110735]
MPANRPAIPSELDRRVRVEAGHRCAVPVFRVPVIEIAHIRPWSKVKRHEFENLIALCPNCHTLFDKGHIDHKSMLQYKANLNPFSPYALAAHPDYIDFLLAYQKFHVFIEVWNAATLAFQEAKKRGVSASELRLRFQAIGHAAKEASCAEFCFMALSPDGVKRLSAQILRVTMRSACNATGGPVPVEFQDDEKISGGISEAWKALHYEIHEAVNKPARKMVRLMSTCPQYVDEFTHENE